MGSVEEISAPNSSATPHDRPSAACTMVPVTAVPISTPGTASSVMGSTFCHRRPAGTLYAPSKSNTGRNTSRIRSGVR